MDETIAKQLAAIIGGDPWQSGGDLWLVVIRRPDGRVVTVSDEVVCEYSDDEAMVRGESANSITLA